MTLEQWKANGWLKAHDVADEELAALLTAAQSDLSDAAADISPAWRFAIAYNAALRSAPLHSRRQDIVLTAIRSTIGPLRRFRSSWVWGCGN